MNREMSTPADSVSPPAANEEQDSLRSTDKARRLIIMTRIPEAGRVKTRLIPALGDSGAAKLHELLLHRVIATASEHAKVADVTVEVRYTGSAGIQFPCKDYPLVSITRVQQGSDLGERLLLVANTANNEGAQAVIIVGTDCPDLSSEILELAWHQLVQKDVVIGPAEDGGYYLIGLQRPHEELFQGIDWGTEQVLSQTLERCRKVGLSFSLLPTLSDVDLPQDLVVCRRIAAGLEQCLPQPIAGLLSIIIPTLNEAENLAGLVSPLLATPNCEVIIVDGGSTDGTPELAEELGCRLIRGTRGRGSQMNAGAALARGEVFLFLHADTRLPVSFREQINATLATAAIAGAFQFQIDSPGMLYRAIEWGTNLRCRFLQLPYGDQGLFLRSSDFFRLGGFKNWPIMEDFEFIRRLRKHGKIVIAPAAAPTSARRWRHLGAFKNTLINQICIAMHVFGFGPQTIARFYSRRN